ncbi:MAG TPA: BlaI/MecI/CopY family transcriptional regulator [Candidatus Nitrosotalea sp.]|nr:BlaI/MecI/CopY family transcriptional regulator [Candidatus Nitrosotalea sp.]
MKETFDDDRFTVSLRDSTKYEDAIYKALQREKEFSYTDLHNEVREIIPCNDVTFSRHLKRMVEQGIVIHEKKGSPYQLDPEIKTQHLTVQKLNAQLISIYDARTKHHHELLDSYKELSAKTKKLSAKTKLTDDDPRWAIVEFFRRTSNGLLKMYLIVTFMANSNSQPPVVEREGTLLCSHILKNIRDLFEKLNQIDPVLHQIVYNSTIKTIGKIAPAI